MRASPSEKLLVTLAAVLPLMLIMLPWVVDLVDDVAG